MLVLVLTGLVIGLGKAPAIEALVPREPSKNNESAPQTEVQEPPIVRLLHREGYSEQDLNLGEGENARYLLVLHASMREVDISPLEIEEEDGKVEQDTSEAGAQVVEVGAST